MSGHIKIDRRILYWEWYKTGNTLRLFIHLILNANWKDGRFQGVEIPRGSLASSYQNLAENTGMSIQNIRTAVKNLKSTGELTVRRYAKFSVFTVKNYDRYQSSNTEANVCLTEDQQAANSHLTTIEERKEGKKGRRESEGTPAPPTLEDVREYCRENGLIVDADYFFDHYASQKWMTGKGTKVTDWKGKLRNWDRQDRKKARSKGTQAKATGFTNFAQREYDWETLEEQLLENSCADPSCDTDCHSLDMENEKGPGRAEGGKDRENGQGE